MKHVNLWVKVGTECLDKARLLLEQESIPTASTVKMVRTLVETAILIDEADFRWENNAPFCVKSLTATQGGDESE